MRLPLEQVPALGLRDWLAGSATPLAIAAHPSGELMALARGPTLAVLPLLAQADPYSSSEQPYSSSHEQHSSSWPVHHCKHEVTALAWFVQLRPHRSVNPTRYSPVKEQQHPAAAGVGLPDRQQQQQQRSKQSAMPADQQPQRQRTAAPPQALLECGVLLSGTADGHLQIHSASGQLLFRQRLMAGPVLDILVRPHCSGLRCSDASEEVCVTFSNALVRISALDLRSHVRMLQLAAGGGPNAAATIGPLPHVRYEVPSAVGARVSALSFGPLPADLYALLSSAAAGSGSSFVGGGRSSRHKICIVTVGRSPCLAVFEAEEQPSRSTLAALVGMASSLTSGVVGAASKAAGLGPSLMYHGVKSLMRPLAGWYSGSSAAGSSGDDGSSSVVSFEDLQQLPKPESISLLRQLRDDDRVLEGLVPAPVGPLLLAPDNLGRVMLLEGSSMTAIRMWKGYRDAQCGWLLPPPHHPAGPLGLLLVLFAPKRQVLEVWLPRSGQRLASQAVDYPCLLVGVGLPCGGWGNGAVLAAWQEQCSYATTLVLNVETGQVLDAMDCLLEEED